MLIELVRSISTWAGRVVLINAHGGNVEPLGQAVNLLRHEWHRVSWAACVTPSTDTHASFGEASVMLYLCPEQVRLGLAETGNTAPLADVLPHLRRLRVRAMAPNGVLGDPMHATVEAGGRLLRQMVDDVHEEVLEGCPDAAGRLRTPGPRMQPS